MESGNASFCFALHMRSTVSGSSLHPGCTQTPPSLPPLRESRLYNYPPTQDERHVTSDAGAAAAAVKTKTWVLLAGQRRLGCLLTMSFCCRPPLALASPLRWANSNGAAPSQSCALPSAAAVLSWCSDCRARQRRLAGESACH